MCEQPCPTEESGRHARVHSTCGFELLEVISGGKTPLVVRKKFKTRNNKLLLTFQHIIQEDKTVGWKSRNDGIGIWNSRHSIFFLLKKK